MRAVSVERARTPKDVGGHDADGSVVGNGRCGITADLRGTRRTPTELVKSQLLCQLSYRPYTVPFPAPKGNRTPVPTLKEWCPNR